MRKVVRLLFETTRADSLTLIVVTTSLAFALTPDPVLADGGGVSFWAPGQFGSFSAVPGEPGWSVPLVYHHASASAGTPKSFQLKNVAGGDNVFG